MALTVQPLVPTGTPNGVPLVVGTSSTTLHTATAVAGQTDVLDIKAANVTASPVVLTLTINSVVAFTGAIAANSTDNGALGRYRVSGGVVVAATGATASAINLSATALREAQ